MEVKDYSIMNNASLKKEMMSLELEHEGIKQAIIQKYKELDEIDSAYNQIKAELTKRHALI